VRGRRLLAAATVLAAAIALFALLAGPALAGRRLTTQVTLSAYDQEPGAVVSPRVTTRDQMGRPIPGVRCIVSWRLPEGSATKVRYSSAAGVARDPRRIAGLPGDTQVVITVRSTWRGQVSRCRTEFRVQRPVPAEPTILFVGDSITLGMFALDEYGCYRMLVAQQFPCMPLTAASSGAQSKDVDLESVRDAAADIVVVELGTNDASTRHGHVPVDPAVFRRNLRAVAEAARAGSVDARLVFLTVWQAPRRRAAYDARITDLAAAYGGHVVSLAAIKDDPECAGPSGVATFLGTSDGWHPNDYGHERISRRLAASIRRLLHPVADQVRRGLPRARLW
jgi:lysophospholipase L1-like esterase